MDIYTQAIEEGRIKVERVVKAEAIAKKFPTKEQKEAATRRETVLAFLKEQTEPVTRDTIAAGLGISPAQATAACKALGDAVTKLEAKVGKSKKIVYQIAE